MAIRWTAAFELPTQPEANANIFHGTITAGIIGAAATTAWAFPGELVRAPHGDPHRWGTRPNLPSSPAFSAASSRPGLRIMMKHAASTFACQSRLRNDAESAAISDARRRWAAKAFCTFARHELRSEPGSVHRAPPGTIRHRSSVSLPHRGRCLGELFQLWTKHDRAGAPE
jgi:hypothetical protein